MYIGANFDYMRPWIIFVILFTVCGCAFFAARLRGYRYIGASFLLATLCLVNAMIVPSPVKYVFFALVIVGLVYFLTVEAIILKNRRTDINPKKAFLVVLGAEVDGTVPSLSLFHRLQAALDYLNEYSDAKAIVCGGMGDTEQITEAECMYRWLNENGIDPNRIVQENKSVSTEENLRFALEIIKNQGGTESDAAVLSSPYHLFRAKLMAESFGYKSIAGVACVHGYPIFTIGMYIREAFGVTHFLLLRKSRISKDNEIG